MSATGYYLGTPGNLQGSQPALPKTGNPLPTPPTTYSPFNFAPQSVSPSGPSQGYDPSFLQNLSTFIGGLFSRPNGNLSFNPLGNLSDVPSQQLGYGNAPLFGLPNTLLQDALNASLFAGTTANPTGGGGGVGIGGGGGGGYGGGPGQKNPNPINGLGDFMGFYY